ncbi:MAG: nascent polypeptide-associated complex protein [Candidatus Thermoplasmatota archaeon]|nr:nascent polypeptide-associated complex protein [Candidatus Thermoplasmatota archaeon]
MMPGGRGGFDPRNMAKMMKQLGISIEEVEDVEEVVIRTATKEIVIPKADVSIMDAQGQRTFQITGEAQERKIETGPDPEDVELVMDQAGVDEETAKQALEAAGGEPAQAIMDLMEE